jgi:hypothetical protein
VNTVTVDPRAQLLGLLQREHDPQEMKTEADAQSDE